MWTQEKAGVLGPGVPPGKGRGSWGVEPYMGIRGSVKKSGGRIVK